MNGWSRPREGLEPSSTWPAACRVSTWRAKSCDLYDEDELASRYLPLSDKNLAHDGSNREISFGVLALPPDDFQVAVESIRVRLVFYVHLRPAEGDHLFQAQSIFYSEDLDCLKRFGSSFEVSLMYGWRDHEGSFPFSAKHGEGGTRLINFHLYARYIARGRAAIRRLIVAGKTGRLFFGSLTFNAYC